jgi:hypothetical protein
VRESALWDLLFVTKGKNEIALAIKPAARTTSQPSSIQLIFHQETFSRLLMSLFGFVLTDPHF